MSTRNLRTVQEKMKKNAIIQARLGSTRLPRKVLLDLQGKPVLKWVIDRVGQAKTIDQVVVATSTSKGDDEIVKHCLNWSVPYFRGSENDVLGRFVEAAKKYDADLVIRINADNPLIDPFYIDELVKSIVADSSEYQSYQTLEGNPVMLTALSFFAEAVTMDCLTKADKIIKDVFEREHVTLGIYKRPDTFKVKFLNVPDFCRGQNVRLTLDTSKDYELLKQIFEKAGPGIESIHSADVIEMIKRNPQWLEMMREQTVLNPKTDKKG